MNYENLVARSKHLRPDSNYPVYPPYHQGPYLEEYFFNQYRPTERLYLPIFWTACYNTGVGGIQEFLNTLDQDKAYFTVSQHDDAPREHLPPNTKIFNAGGNQGGIPIPLICSPFPEIKKCERDIFCSFRGAITHPIRQKMTEVDPRLVIEIVQPSSFDTIGRFEDLLARSVFSLCPRGYGATSFRLYETIQYESIPVYLYDKLWLPYQEELNWNEFAVLIHESEIHRLAEILNTINIDKMQNKLQEVKRFFTLLEVCKYITSKL